MATLEQLVGMGFSEDSAKNALEAHGSAALDVLLGAAPEPTSRRVRARICRLVGAARLKCECWSIAHNRPIVVV